MRLFLYFSELLTMDVIDSKGDLVGTVHDITLAAQGDIYPKVSHLVMRRGAFSKEYAALPWDDVLYVEDEVRLKVSLDDVLFSPKPLRFDFTLRRDILDQQVVDTDNQKVVRVNDIHLLRVDHTIYVAHVDVGIRGLVRRLEWTDLVDGCVRMVNAQSTYLKHEELIPWKAAQAIPKLGRMRSVLKLDVARNKLSALPPAALADIMQDLDIFTRTSIFKTLDASLQNKVFTDLNLDHKIELLDQLDDDQAVLIVQNIPSDEATDLLMKLPRAKTHQLMRLMASDTNKKFRKLLGFAKDSAGGLMTTEYLTLSPNATVEEAWRKIKANADFAGSIFFLYIVDADYKFRGTTSLRRFINKPNEALLIDTCYPENLFVYTDDSVEEVALLLERYKLSSIPVLNREDHILQGVITIDDVMEELIALVWKKYKEKL